MQNYVIIMAPAIVLAAVVTLFYGKLYDRLHFQKTVLPAIGAAVLKNAQTVVNDDGTTSFVPNANIFLAAFLAAVALIIVLLLVFCLIRKEKTHETH